MNKEIQIKHHEIILQADQLSRALYTSSILARKIIAFSASRIQEKMIDTDWSSLTKLNNISLPVAEFKISELLRALGLSNSGENYYIIKNTIKEIRGLGLEIINDKKIYQAYNWFSSVYYNEDIDQIELTFTPEIGWTLYELKDGYTALNLQTIGVFKSFYAFRFYEIALSWRGMQGRKGNNQGCWWFQMSTDEIRKTFKIDQNAYSGRINNFTMWVIQKPIEELNRVNSQFKIEYSKVKRGQKIIGFRFDCTTLEKEPKKIRKTDSDLIVNQKKLINDEDKAIQKLKKRHLDWWKEVYQDNLKHPLPFGDPELNAQNKANLALLEEFGHEL